MNRDKFLPCSLTTAWVTNAAVFQTALISGELKLKFKGANVAGWLLADLLGHPVKQWGLKRYGVLSDELAPFAQQLMNVVEPKFNRHGYDQRLEDYGVVLYPKK